MKRNEEYLSELATIQSILNKINTLNEAIMFEDDFEDQYADPSLGQEGEEVPQEAEPQGDVEGAAGAQAMEKMDPEEEGMAELDEMGEIDRIREITLSGMHKLCKNPQDPKYQALKKIFQMCDKGVEEEIKNQQQVQ